MTITTAQKTHLNKSMRSAQDVELGSRIAARGAYTVVAADDTAGTVDIDTGFTNGEAFLVQIFRAGVNVMDDAVVSLAAGVLTVADGGATYALTADDVINYLVF